MPHILGSAYILGADEHHLGAIYESESEELDKWHDSPGEISKHDWRDYLGDPHYARAYVDFFEDELVNYGYDWKKVVTQYLFEGKHPLINSVVAGLGHPLIHLGYAFELSSRDIAMEALGLAATQYNYFHKILDDPEMSKTSPFSSTSPLELLEKAHDDERFDALFQGDKSLTMEELFRHHKDLMLEYWNAWTLTEPKKQFEDSQHAAMLLLAGTQEPDAKSFSFYFVHALTSSHAVRILLPFVPPQFEVPLVRQWWLLVFGIYITQGRPEIGKENVSVCDVDGDNWHSLVELAISGKHSLDAHYVKGIRALKEAASTWGDDDEMYLKAAAKFAKQFDGWFTSTEELC